MMEIIRRRVKYPRIEINPEGKIKVIAPSGYDVSGFVKRKQTWIDKKLSEISGLKRQAENKGDRFLLNGLYYELKTGSALEIDIIRNIMVMPELTELHSWLKEKLREEVSYKAKSLSRLVDVNYGKIYIKRQRTRWASCSSKGNLSFNVAMMALPETLREYIIIHELSHQLERNHSKKFWKIVGQHYPNYKKAREELKQYSLMVAKNGIWNKLMEC
jgi:predicted metal-dependent hydrolase